MPTPGEPRPKDWESVSKRVRERAGDACEWCHARNGAVGYRDEKGVFHELSPLEAEAAALDGRPIIHIALAVAHLSRKPGDRAEDALAALCQACRQRYGAPQRAISRAEAQQRKLAEAGQGRLL